MGTSSSSLSQTLYVNSGSGTSGSFSKALGSLAANTTYYYRAYILTSDNQYVYGSVKSFTTKAASSSTGDPAAYAQSWLAGYEVPATSVSLSSSASTYAGKYCHSTVAESYGSTNACIYNTNSSTQRVVTHTFSYGGKVLPNYTMLFDAGKKCALWVAFEMSASYPDSNVGRNEAWVADPAINASWQLNGSYGSAYSKGHQVASGDRQTSTDQNKQTFYYSNMTPQLQDLNGTTWATLENDIQKLGFGLSGSTRLFVVTGPLFEGSTSTTNCGTNGTCPVPTGYFKCIMRCTFDASGNMTGAQGAGYIFNHANNAPRQTVSIDAVESRTGFDLFANVPAALQATAESTAYNFF